MGMAVVVWRVRVQVRVRVRVRVRVCVRVCVRVDSVPSTPLPRASAIRGSVTRHSDSYSNSEWRDTVIVWRVAAQWRVRVRARVLLTMWRVASASGSSACELYFIYDM